MHVALETYLELGIIAQPTYNTATPSLNTFEREGLVRILDDLSDFYSFVRGARPKAWDESGREERYQGLRTRLGEYLRSESNALQGPVHNSALVRKLLNDRRLAEDHTPGVPAVMHTSIPDFTGAGLDALAELNPADQETLFAAMTAFQNAVMGRETWQYTALPIAVEAGATRAQVTERQLESEVQYVIPNSALYRLKYAVELARNVRDGRLMLSSEAKDAVRRLAQAELETVDRTLLDLHAYVLAVYEVMASVEARLGIYQDQPGVRVDWDYLRSTEGIILADLLNGVDTSIPAMRRMGCEVELHRLYNTLTDAVGKIEQILPDTVLMPRFRARARKIPRGVNLTPAEGRLEKMNYWAYAVEALGEIGPDQNIADLVRAVGTKKREVMKQAKLERDRLVYDGLYASLTDVGYDTLNLRDKLLGSRLTSWKADATQLIAVARRTEREDDAKNSQALLDKIIAKEREYKLAQWDVRYEEQIEGYHAPATDEAITIERDQWGTVKTGLEQRLIAARNLWDEAITSQGDRSSRAHSYMQTVEMHLAAVVGYIKSQDATSQYAETNNERVERESREAARSRDSRPLIFHGSLSSPMLFDGGSSHPVRYGGVGGSGYSELFRFIEKIPDARVRPTPVDRGDLVDPRMGEQDQIADGEADMNWYGITFTGLATVAALSEAIGETVYLDPSTRRATTTPHDKSMGAVDLLAFLHAGTMGNVRSDPSLSEEEYWNNPLRVEYSMGRHPNLVVTRLGPVGSGAVIDAKVRTGTLQVTLAGGDVNGFELYKQRQKEAASSPK